MRVGVRHFESLYARHFEPLYARHFERSEKSHNVRSILFLLTLLILLSPFSTLLSFAQNPGLPAKIKGRTEQVIKHTGYTVSYNEDWKIPNWVAYELTAAEVQGEVGRTNDFVPDPDVWGATATTFDYKGSGYDRGHMAPAGDMKWSRKAMVESFYLSNICPQNHNLNGGDWKELEEQVRAWATAYGSVYIVCGPVVADENRTIGEGVVVPAGFFKIVLRKLRDGRYSALGFYYSNKAGSKPMESYLYTVEEIETISQINLLPSVPASVKESVNLEHWR